MKILSNGIAVIDGDLWESKWVEEAGKLDHDRYAIPIILEHIKEGDIVIDAGALIGDHTIAYEKKVGVSGKVYAFEPNKEAFECLLYNCKNTVSYNKALGDKNGFVKLKLCANHPGINRIGNLDPRFTFISDIEVITLDSLNLPKLNFIKADVEGYELKVLKGARKTIDKCRPGMWLEINKAALEEQGTSKEELLEYIESDLNYSITAYPPQYNELQYDALCLSK